MSEEKDDYLDFLYKAYHYSVEQFDKNILFVSSGALGLSLTFIEKIVPLATAKHKWVLLASWYILTIAISLSLLTHFFSFKNINQFIKSYNPDNNKETEKVRRRYNLLLSWLNIILILFVFSGILFLITFIYLNINGQEN